MFGKKKDFNSIKINNEEDEETAKTVVNFMKWTQFLIEAAFSSCVFSMDDANFHLFFFFKIITVSLGLEVNVLSLFVMWKERCAKSYLNSLLITWTILMNYLTFVTVS